MRNLRGGVHVLSQNYPKLPFWGGRAWKGSVLSVWRLQQLKVGAGIAI